MSSEDILLPISDLKTLKRFSEYLSRLFLDVSLINLRLFCDESVKQSSYFDSFNLYLVKYLSSSTDSVLASIILL